MFQSNNTIRRLSPAGSCCAAVAFLLLICLAAAETQAQARRGDYIITQSADAVPQGTVDTGNHCDDCRTFISLPFPVMIYDQMFTTARVGSNGNLQFVSNNGEYDNTNLPNSSFNTTIFAFWDDLYTADPGTGIYTSVTGTAPRRAFNIEWRASSYDSAAARANFAIQLLENSSTFNIIYGATSGDPNFFSGTIGVQRDTGSFFTQYAGGRFSSQPSSQLQPPAAGTKLIFSLSR